MLVDEHAPYRWELIATQVPGKSPAEIRQHYEDLVHDVAEIECGRVQVPEYEDREQLQGRSPPHVSAGNRSGVSVERRKGVPWTEEEHRLFLMGLQKYGKGDWRSISRKTVVSRTPTQVASHAQKYFLRLSSDKKRSSIHDVSVSVTETGSSFGIHESVHRVM